MRTVLFRGRWLIGHALVIVTSVSFVLLGVWQFGRHNEKQDAERDAREAYATPAPTLDEIGDDPAPGTRAEVIGTYDADAEVLLRNRVRDGEGGFDVVTPLIEADGTGVLVDRGWVSRIDVARDLPDLTAPDGEVTVRGTVHESRPLQPDDTVDERGGRTTLPRVDVARIADGVDYELRSVWVTAQYQDPPPTDGEPAPPEPAESDNVDHRSYAFQWFALALIPLVGWPLVLARRHRRAPTAEPV